MDEVFHNRDRLKDGCKKLVESQNSRHKSISENHMLKREFARKEDARFCSECCAVVLVEDYE